MNQMVEVVNLTKSYSKHIVLANVSFTLNEGEIVGLIGPNGSGKSTLMKCLCSIQKPDFGEIYIDGIDLNKYREKALKIQSSLIENPALFLELTGEENLELISVLRNVSKDRLNDIKAWSGLGDKLRTKASKYSLGMKQRLALSMCILNEPRFLILDEPMNGLDPQGVIQLRNELREMRDKYHNTILISSHQLSEIEKIVDRCLYIENQTIKEVNKQKSKGYRLRTDKRIVEKDQLSFSFVEKDDTSCEYYIFDENVNLETIVSELRLLHIQVIEYTTNIDSLENEYVEIFGVHND